MKKLFFGAVISMLLLSACAPAEVTNEYEINESSTDNFESTASAVLNALKFHDMVTFSLYADPEKGVRFSPYGHINAETDIIFSADEIKSIYNNESEIINWGVYDGSGLPIDLTFKEYYEKFIFDHDYLTAEQTAIDEIIGTGNTINNIKEVYPDGKFIEYYFSGFDPQYEGMDWASLRLVFEKFEDEWKLVGVIHDQWTI